MRVALKLRSSSRTAARVADFELLYCRLTELLETMNLSEREV